VLLLSACRSPSVMRSTPPGRVTRWNSLRSLEPFPGTQPARPKAQIHQVKEALRNFEPVQGIHLVELHAIADLLSLGLRSRVMKHFIAHIPPDQQGRYSERFRQFDEPATSPATDIEHALKVRRAWLFWQHTAHRGSHHPILEL